MGHWANITAFDEKVQLAAENVQWIMHAAVSGNSAMLSFLLR